MFVYRFINRSLREPIYLSLFTLKGSHVQKPFIVEVATNDEKKLARREPSYLLRAWEGFPKIEFSVCSPTAVFSWRITILQFCVHYLGWYKQQFSRTLFKMASVIFQDRPLYKLYCGIFSFFWLGTVKLNFTVSYFDV